VQNPKGQIHFERNPKYLKFRAKFRVYLVIDDFERNLGGYLSETSVAAISGEMAAMAFVR